MNQCRVFGMQLRKNQCELCRRTCVSEDMIHVLHWWHPLFPWREKKMQPGLFLRGWDWQEVLPFWAVLEGMCLPSVNAFFFKCNWKCCGMPYANVPVNAGRRLMTFLFLFTFTHSFPPLNTSALMESLHHNQSLTQSLLLKASMRIASCSWGGIVLHVRESTRLSLK